MKSAMRIAAGRATHPEGDGAAGGGAGAPHGAPVARLDPDGFAREYQGAFRALWCIAAGVLGDRGRAADVVQDAALIALRKLGEFEPGTSFVAWMGRIVRFTAINERRKTIRQRTSPVEPASLDIGHRNGSASAVAEGTGVVDDHGALLPGAEAFDDAVLGALEELTDQARSCLLLRTVLDMPYREISLALDIPEGTAMSHVHRARRSMRSHLLAKGMGREGAGEDGKEDRS